MKNQNMKSELFVKIKYPRAIAEKHKNSEGKGYWLIREFDKGKTIAVGKTKIKAWDFGKEIILRKK